MVGIVLDAERGVPCSIAVDPEGAFRSSQL